MLRVLDQSVVFIGSFQELKVCQTLEIQDSTITLLLQQFVFS